MITRKEKDSHKIWKNDMLSVEAIIDESLWDKQLINDFQKNYLKLNPKYTIVHDEKNNIHYGFKKGTKVAHWDPTNTIFEQEWSVTGSEVGTAIENDSRFPTITVSKGTSPLTHSNWASPAIQEYLGTMSTPSPTENF